MENLVDELIRIARRCERTAKKLTDGPLAEAQKAILKACGEVGKAASDSWLGYQAGIYLSGLRPRRPGEHFSIQDGIENDGWGGGQTVGPWQEFSYEEIRKATLGLAGVNDTSEMESAAESAKEVFDACKRNVLPIIDALIATNPDPIVQESKNKLIAQKDHIFQDELIRAWRPAQQSTADERVIASPGFQTPHHLQFLAWAESRFSYGRNLMEMAWSIRHLTSYLHKRMEMKGTSIGKTDGKIFIGHGRSAVWRDLKDFLQDRLGLECEEFNREPVAGKSTKERLEEMLDTACFAFLLMTAEDETADGARQARPNVIHEVGLFQGRLGFERAIVLLEEGCAEFSNIIGLSQIRFPRGNIVAKTEEIRRVLEREKLTSDRQA